MYKYEQNEVVETRIQLSWNRSIFFFNTWKINHFLVLNDYKNFYGEGQWSIENDKLRKVTWNRWLVSQPCRPLPLPSKASANNFLPFVCSIQYPSQIFGHQFTKIRKRFDFSALFPVGAFTPLRQNFRARNQNKTIKVTIKLITEIIIII